MHVKEKVDVSVSYSNIIKADCMKINILYLCLETTICTCLIKMHVKDVSV